MGRTSWTMVVALVLGLAIPGCQGACTSMRLAPKPDAEVQGIPLPYAVAVERSDFPPVYDERLVEALRASGVFARVDLAGDVREPAPLVARVLAPSEGAAVIPILTAVTLGLFPTWAEETWGLRFSLAPAGAPERAVAIDFRWSGYTVLGWASALLNLSPNRAGSNPAEGPRYAAHVAATIAPHVPAIERMASAR